MDLKKALTIEPLEDGDIVAVQAARPNTVFVGGLVNVAGAQAYPPGTQVTVLQALAAAGGLRMDLIPPEATLIRRLEDKDVQVKLDLDRLSKGKDRNIALAPGDILWVPHTVGTRIHDFINQTVYVRIGATAGYTAYYSDMGSKRYGDLKDRGAETVIITK
jgi:protein involved in polysaccharide export with SLBB domain